MLVSKSRQNIKEVEMKKIPCCIVRGGTSKGIFFNGCDLPVDKSHLDNFLLDVMGSPDAKQIDGLGGANSLTSKVAIVSKSKMDGVDVDYTFAQVSITDQKVDVKGNCGNISSAVGLFAINQGLVSVEDGNVTVSIYNTNTKKVIYSSMLVKDGTVVEEGDVQISGVPGKAAAVNVSFSNPQGAVTGKLLPTGNATDHIETSFGSFDISIIDAANPLVYMRAEDLELTGLELPQQFDEILLGKIEEVRSIAAQMCGFSTKENATKESPAVPKATIISSPKDYVDSNGVQHSKNDYDISVRMMSMQKPHNALAITGAVCTAVASRVEGSLVNAIVKNTNTNILIAHPGGVMSSSYTEKDDVVLVSVVRTARMIMSGFVFTKKEY
jgi:hypothetical protein